MLKGITTHGIQGIAVGQLCLPQGTELLSRRMQFQLGGDHLFHTSRIEGVHTNVNRKNVCSVCQFLPLRKRRGPLGAECSNRSLRNFWSTQFTKVQTQTPRTLSLDL